MDESCFAAVFLRPFFVGETGKECDLYEYCNTYAAPTTKRKG